METTKTLQLNVSSEAFAHEEEIPVKYTCNGEGINPPLNISNIPDETQTLALIVEDPDAPGGTYDHWIVWNIDPVSVLKENFSPGISGSNSGGKTGIIHPVHPAAHTVTTFTCLRWTLLLTLRQEHRERSCSN